MLATAKGNELLSQLHQLPLVLLVYLVPISKSLAICMQVHMQVGGPSTPRPVHCFICHAWPVILTYILQHILNY